VDIEELPEDVRYLYCVIQSNLKKKIDWLVFNANFSSISAVSWCDQILQINFLFYKTLRNKTYFQI
jgi:hypothetical protein